MPQESAWLFGGLKANCTVDGGEGHRLQAAVRFLPPVLLTSIILWDHATNGGR